MAEKTRPNQDYKILQTFIAHAPAAIAMFDHELRYIVASRRWMEDYKLGQQDIRGKLQSEIFPKIPDCWKAIHKRGLSGEVIREAEDRFVREDGTVQWLKWEMQPWYSEEQKVCGIVMYTEDITSRKNTELRLQESEERFRTLADNISQLVWMADPKGSIFWFNKRWYDYTGTEPDTMKERGLELIVHPEFYEKVVQSYLDAVEKGVEWEYTFPMQKKDGGYRWFLTRALPVRNEGGTIVRWFGTNTDISELRSTQEQLTRERNFVDAILQTSGALISVLDEELRFVQFNKACERLTGYHADEVKNHSVFELFIPDDERDAVMVIEEQLKHSDEIVVHENHWLTKTGEKRFIRWRNTVLHDERGKVSYIIATGIDISDRKSLEERLKKQTQELIAANGAMESFSYSVSHDLQGPLSTIHGFTTILREEYADILDDNGKYYLKQIDSNVKFAQQLISDLLSLSRIGRQEINRVMINLSEMVRGCFRELMEKGPERKIEMVIQENVRVFADSHLIHIELENLLRNAWKFTSKNEVARIEFGTVSIDGKEAFFVRDNGIGFDKKFAVTIFEPFKRAHAQKEYSGTGIGLSIVKRVVSRHGGEVWAEGEVGKGATFYFTLG